MRLGRRSQATWSVVFGRDGDGDGDGEWRCFGFLLFVFVFGLCIIETRKLQASTSCAGAFVQAIPLPYLHTFPQGEQNIVTQNGQYQD